jgi:hypothetical protein
MQPLRSVGAFNGSKGSCTGGVQAIGTTTDSFNDVEEASTEGGLGIRTTAQNTTAACEPDGGEVDVKAPGEPAEQIPSRRDPIHRGS